MSETNGTQPNPDGGGRRTASRQRSRRRASKAVPIPSSPTLPDGGIAIVEDGGSTIHLAPRQVALSVRYLLARLQLNDAAGLPVRLAITSALRGEGVTYICRTLGAVLAHDLKRPVCIVDLNWFAQPREQVEDGPAGIVDVMHGRTTLDEVLIRTTDPNLCLVPAGNAPLAIRPALAEDLRLDPVLDELEQRFEHLVLDLPPVLVSSDALTMARLCDAYALVVRHGVTAEHHVRDAIDELRAAGLLGVVLNRATSKIPKRLRNLVSA